MKNILEEIENMIINNEETAA